MTEYPKDPMMLMSWVNMKLRDFYPSLETMCEDLEIPLDELVEKLTFKISRLFFSAKDLVFKLRTVTAFIGGFKMHKNKVIFIKKSKCGLCLSVIIGVEKTCCPFNIWGVHFCTFCNAFEEINSRYHCAFDTIFLLEVVKARCCAFSPKPNVVCTIFAR